MALETCHTLFYIDRDMESVETEPATRGEFAVFAARCPGREGPNEDAAALIPVADDHYVLALADGFGGHPAGAEAAKIAVRTIQRFVCEAGPTGESLRSPIVDGFEKADEAVRGMGVGAATTLAVVDIEGNRVRSYHVGDSSILVVGQRGRIKMKSVPHSPVGYAVESGLIDEDEAMHHEERHVVSNMVGSAEMRIEIGPSLRLAPRDTVLLGSDGLFDNLSFEEVVEVVRKGTLTKAVATLMTLSHERMTSPREGDPSKPDDVTVLAFRPVPLR
jgi:serine/threonine protein phosphatase PrpC